MYARCEVNQLPCTRAIATSQVGQVSIWLLFPSSYFVLLIKTGQSLAIKLNTCSSHCAWSYLERTCHPYISDVSFLSSKMHQKHSQASSLQTFLAHMRYASTMPRLLSCLHEHFLFYLTTQNLVATALCTMFVHVIIMPQIQVCIPTTMNLKVITNLC